MKGKFYSPNTEQSSYISMRKSHSTQFSKNFSVTSIECVWQTSIPESWEKIMRKKKISNIKISKSSRNTLEFLKETQKYIRDICRPDTNEVNIIPRKLEKTSSGTRLIRRNSQFCRSLVYEENDKNIFMRNRRKKVLKLDPNGSAKEILLKTTTKNIKEKSQQLIKFYLKRHCH
ncbi:hypothetical protein SteCoe_27210 [Stentor coeruleus]|uniref:Uncharacterized protein n=1 Tax=Stentor coeruleus TaxID=5963 RepID=A0A1R2BB36_9CILI|nr:hypothetical protein SteCoe_27210 [Stentor coeruleus]